MTDRSYKTTRARAEAVFRKPTEPVLPADDKPASKSRPVETTQGAMDEYLARQDAERAKMARLRKLRLAAEAKAGVKAKGKPGGTGKRT